MKPFSQDFWQRWRRPKAAGPFSGSQQAITGIGDRVSQQTGATQSRRSHLTTSKLEAMLRLSQADLQSGAYRVELYRFLANQIPLINACLWTWSRLAAAPGRYLVTGADDPAATAGAEARLARLADNLSFNVSGQARGLTSFLVDLFLGLFRDGLYAGFVTVNRDASGVDRFYPVDAKRIRAADENTGSKGLVWQKDDGVVDLMRPDFYHLALNSDNSDRLGRSILQTVPFITYIEQQLIDDMRRSSHNSGFHRLHVRITPPERMAGEADGAYVNRINQYFDDTVRMVRSCDVDDNPVTWDNVTIESIGPRNNRSVSQQWYLNHRAMVEEICAGTNLAPFMLGYSFGATRTWAQFKFDLIMRQVRTVQAEAARMLKWIGDIDLALAGYALECRFEFDNSFAYQAIDSASVQASRADSLLKLYQAGLLDQAEARKKAASLI